MTDSRAQTLERAASRRFLVLSCAQDCSRRLRRRCRSSPSAGRSTTITRDPLDLGLIGLSQFLPFVVLILPAGHAADHYDRRRILALCYATEIICASCIAVLHDSRRGSRMARLRRDDAARRCARVLDAERSGVAAESRSARELHARGCAQLHRVPDRDDPRTCARRRAVPGRSACGLRKRGGARTASRAFSCCAFAQARVRREARTSLRAGRRSCRDCASCARNRSCSGRSRSICSPCCSAARRRCCPCSQATFCASVRADSVCCAPRLASAPVCARWCSRSVRSRATSGAGCSAASLRSASQRSCSA